MAKVTGIGGVIFQSSGNPEELAAWYSKHLGMELEDFGGSILFWPEDPQRDGGLTIWHVAGPDSDHFKENKSPFMINYRVDDLDQLCSNLKSANVEILEGPNSYENGKFAWIRDPEGNKLELWEPMAWDDKNKKH